MSRGATRAGDIDRGAGEHLEALTEADEPVLEVLLAERGRTARESDEDDSEDGEGVVAWHCGAQGRLSGER